MSEKTVETADQEHPAQDLREDGRCPQCGAQVSADDEKHDCEE